ncbi:TetR family transcriptional regulator [Streptomyces sp. IMTB 2501]|uniref:ScbR family autoregulator-binding transcription factor n=1 Tax=Streptomyces sp. IMTB 2501 TaxID=1776340 RepID=UPI00096F7624|nr:ScbR family autoregulator-binding transcription factor [Streptomyces sp. IMTB 2501]OLZ65578.1 TetR family transcriptional regulator [Streptomyces sp. IMTB 2501]
MAKQDRAIRTRRTIVQAAAAVFQEQGYEAATILEILNRAQVTKGALYFHFSSKEELAQAVLAEQEGRARIPARACKLQEMVDLSALHAHRLQTDPLVRAAMRLAMDQRTNKPDRNGPFRQWADALDDTLSAADAQGELLPHVRIKEVSELIVGAFAGVQAMSQALTGYEDVTQRVAQLHRYLLPSIAVPAVLAALDLSPGRGAITAAELDPPDTPIAATAST